MIRACRGGKILNVASIHDTIPLQDRSIYCITKAGMGLLRKSLALELAEYRINVNAISPRAISTNTNREVFSNSAYRETVREKRIGEPKDLVGAAVFLVSPEAEYITGATLYVDGGLLLCG